MVLIKSVRVKTNMAADRTWRLFHVMTSNSSPESEALKGSSTSLKPSVAPEEAEGDDAMNRLQ